jgi:hypothetical protein
VPFLATWRPLACPSGGVRRGPRRPGDVAWVRCLYAVGEGTDSGENDGARMM